MHVECFLVLEIQLFPSIHISFDVVGLEKSGQMLPLLNLELPNPSATNPNTPSYLLSTMSIHRLWRVLASAGAVGNSGFCFVTASNEPQVPSLEGFGGWHSCVDTR